MTSFLFKKMLANLSMVVSGETCLLQPNGVAAVSTNGAMITSHFDLLAVSNMSWICSKVSMKYHVQK